MADGDEVLVGHIVDATGATMEDLPEGELVVTAIVLFKTIDAEGRVSIRQACDDNIDFITRRGMIETARDLEAAWMLRSDDDL